LALNEDATTLMDSGFSRYHIPATNIPAKLPWCCSSPDTIRILDDLMRRIFKVLRK
jgi:hypothetical protein